MSTEYLSRFIIERPHHLMCGGVQRIYNLGNGYGLSLINNPTANPVPYAWEAAVVSGVKESGDFADIVYDTPLTENVEVFYTDEEADDFIRRAFEWASSTKIED